MPHRAKAGQPSRDRFAPRDPRAWVALGVVTLAASCFVAGTFLVPVLEARGLSIAGAARMVYAPLCHQLDARSLHIQGLPVAVCARCSGVYLGGLLGLGIGLVYVVGRRGRPKPIWLAWAALPTILDVIAGWSGLGGLGNFPRMLLALGPGMLLGIYLAIGIYDLFCSRQSTYVHEPGPAPVPEGLDG